MYAWVSVPRMSLKVRLAFPAICFGLGSWQMYRLRWKTQLLASIEEGLALPPIDLDRLPETEEELERIRFRRLKLHSLQYACPKKDVVFVGPRTANGIFGDTNYASIMIAPASFTTTREAVLLNLGWVKWKEEDQIDLPPLESGVEAILDRSEKASFFATANNAAAKLWGSKDLSALASFFHTRPIMFKVIKDQRSDEGRYPRLASATFDIPNRHFEYVLTWYSYNPLNCVGLVIHLIRYGLSAATLLMAFLKR